MDHGKHAWVSGEFLTPSAWRGYRRAGFPAGSWEVKDEMLHALPDAERLSLISRERFADFDLTFEWRLLEGGNSGVLYRVTEDGDDPWQSGPEMQLLDNEAHPDAQVPETSCGALYGLQAPRGCPACHRGLFNIARISVHGSQVEHWVNGVRVLACDLESGEFRQRVARSKFRDFPQFARAREGHLVLQHHGTDAWFYNLRIETP